MNNIDLCIKELGYAVVPISRTMMLPLLKDGRDRVELVANSFMQIKKGDVVLYKKNDGTLVLHRIIKVQSEDVFFALGDHQFKNVEQVYREQIIAVAQAFFVNGHYVDEKTLPYRIYKKVWLSSLFLRRCCLAVLSLKKK